MLGVDSAKVDLAVLLLCPWSRARISFSSRLPHGRINERSSFEARPCVNRRGGYGRVESMLCARSLTSRTMNDADKSGGRWKVMATMAYLCEYWRHRASPPYSAGHPNSYPKRPTTVFRQWILTREDLPIVCGT